MAGARAQTSSSRKHGTTAMNGTRLPWERGSTRSHLYELPLPILGLDLHLPMLIDTPPTRLQDRRCGYRVSQGGQALGIKILGRQRLGVYRTAPIHELLQ